jgi:hypothetical protein
MTVSLSINLDPAIAWERIYQNYIHECEMLLIEVAKLAEKLAKISIIYDKYFKENWDYDKFFNLMMVL